MKKKERNVNILIIIGDNFQGKTTLANNMVSHFPSIFTNSISHVSDNREKRDGEIHGRDYYFVKKSYFDNRDNFLESEDFVNSAGETTIYGTSKKEVARAWEEGKTLILVLEPKGAKNVYSNIDNFEIDGVNYVLQNKLMVILDIDKEEVIKRLNSSIDAEESPLLYKKSLDRINRGEIKEQIETLDLKSIGNVVVRKEYLPEWYLGDIIARLPYINEGYIEFEQTKREELDKFTIYARETLYELSGAEERTINARILRGEIDADDDLVRECCERYSVSPLKLIKHIKDALMYPMKVNIGKDENSTPQYTICRFSNKALVEEEISSFVGEHKHGDFEITSLDVFKEVGCEIHTPHGFFSVQLSAIKNLSLSNFNIDPSVLAEIDCNDKLFAHRLSEKAENKRKGSSWRLQKGV